jgi:uncharacterized damage-inducible protein DinB
MEDTMHETAIGRQFVMNHWATHANLQGISHQESLVHPHPGGNCLNWVLGHVVATRNVLLTTLGEAPIWTDAEAEAYQRGARTPLSPVNARALEDIVTAYNASQEAIVSRVSALTETDLSRPHQGQTLGAWVAGVSFHESYHVGQLGLLRRLLGKVGAIA